MEKQPAIYILASGRHGTLYIGVTPDLVARLHQHRNGLVAGFSGRYAVKRLVYFEIHASMEGAIRREKQIKEWRRMWKIVLIEEKNPNWNDLAIGLVLPHCNSGQPISSFRRKSESTVTKHMFLRGVAVHGSRLSSG